MLRHRPATVRRFAEEGAKVVIADLNDDLGAQLAEELGGTYVHCNVASKEDVDNLFKVAHDTYGRIDIAFNNAGISPPEDDSILDTDLEAWDKVQLVNLTSVYRSAARRSCPTCSSRSPARSSTPRPSLPSWVPRPRRSPTPLPRVACCP